MVQHNNDWFKNSYMDKRKNVLKRLNELIKKQLSIDHQNDYVYRILNEILIQCNKVYPENFN